MPRSKARVINMSKVDDVRQVRELPLLDLEMRWQSQLELARIVKDAKGLVPLFGNPLDAVLFWWREVFENRLDPRRMALICFGAQAEHLDDQTTEFGQTFTRVLFALELDHGRRVTRVEDALYAGACDPANTGAQKLYLQAHKPEKYVPKTKASVSIEDVAAEMEKGSDEQLARIAKVNLTGAGESRTDP